MKGHVGAVLVILVNEDLDAERACSQQAAAATRPLVFTSSLTACFSQASLVYSISALICQLLCIKTLSSVGNELRQQSGNN